MGLGPRAEKTADKRGNAGAVRCSERNPAGEGVIRSRELPARSAGRRFFIAHNAKFATVAADRCTLLHAGEDQSYALRSTVLCAGPSKCFNALVRQAVPALLMGAFSTVLRIFRLTKYREATVARRSGFHPTKQESV
jgi:hypothetical protein